MLEISNLEKNLNFQIGNFHFHVGIFHFQNGNFHKNGEKDFFGNPLKVLFKVGKLIIPSKEEIKMNPRSRSAKLRIAEKK